MVQKLREGGIVRPERAGLTKTKDYAKSGAKGAKPPSKLDLKDVFGGKRAKK